LNQVESAVLWAIDIANDETHGYDQNNGWSPDFDCSSFVISAYEQAGIHVRALGASYTGDMKTPFIKCNFIDVISTVNVSTGTGLQRGDILLRESGHAAIYIGSGKLVNAQWNENGKKTGGTTGDQTGKEICVRSYYNSPWSCVLRFNGNNIIISDPPQPPPSHPSEISSYPSDISITRTGGMKIWMMVIRKRG